MEPVVAIVVAAGSGSRLGGDDPQGAARGRRACRWSARSGRALAAGGVHGRRRRGRRGAGGRLRRRASPTAPIPCRLRGRRGRASGLGAAGLAAHRRRSRRWPSAAFVLVHDAARALVPADVVARVIDACGAGAVAVVPVMPVVDTIRQADRGRLGRRRPDAPARSPDAAGLRPGRSCVGAHRARRRATGVAGHRRRRRRASALGHPVDAGGRARARRSR